jgi:uncharacterized protein
MADDKDDESITTAEAGSMSSGKFQKGSERASEAGRKGAEAQPREAKIEGGKHSHGGGRPSESE